MFTLVNVRNDTDADKKVSVLCTSLFRHLVTNTVYPDFQESYTG